ncbi:MAG TPA: magnesium transporter [Candidatus Limnocylindria bacterium]
MARADERVGDVLDRMRGARFDYAGTIYVIDPQGRLVGHSALTTLLASAPGRPVRELMAEVRAVVTPEMDQERAATIAIRHRVPAVPVVDADGRLLGVLPPEALMEVLRAEHLEDLHRLSGVRRDEVMARQAIEGPALRRARDRLPWLLIGLAGSALVTVVMALFESTLQSMVAVAFFVPGIVYLADAIGTQTEAAAVRGLSLVHEPLRQLVWGELRTGVLMGVTLAAIALPGVWLVFGELPLAVAVAGALVGAGAVATTIGLLLPWLLSRVGRDPAYGSGPLATVVQDLLSILIYLTIVSLVLR